MGIIILPPDINKSDSDFTIEPNDKSLSGLAVRLGFTVIKNVGEAAIETIIETRKRVGKFNSLTQFIQDTDSRKVNKKVLECLIKVGAMDQFGTRASMLENLEQIRQQAVQFEAPEENQDHLFSGIASESNQTSAQDNFPKLPEYPRQELLSFEKELLGLYLTEHPMARALQTVSRQANKTIADLDATIHNGHVFQFGGVITQIKIVKTKKTNSDMAFGRFQDETGSLEFLVFPKVYEEFKQYFQVDTVVLMKAKVDYKDEELKLLVEKVTPPNDLLLNHEASAVHHEVFIPRKTKKEILVELGKLLKAHPGDESVAVLIPNGGEPQRMVLPYGVAWTPDLEKEIGNLLQ